jgi:hypothetical protein
MNLKLYTFLLNYKLFQIIANAFDIYYVGYSSFYTKLVGFVTILKYFDDLPDLFHIYIDFIHISTNWLVFDEFFMHCVHESVCFVRLMLSS